MRSNTFKVFCQLSKCGSRKEFYAFTQLASVRRFGRRRSRVAADLDAEGVDGSSNLFYYLFEDYTAAIDILKGSKLVLDEIVLRSLPLASVLFFCFYATNLRLSLLTICRGLKFSAQRYVLDSHAISHNV